MSCEWENITPEMCRKRAEEFDENIKFNEYVELYGELLKKRDGIWRSKYHFNENGKVENSINENEVIDAQVTILDEIVLQKRFELTEKEKQASPTVTFDYDFSQRHIMVVSDNCTVEKEIKIVFNSKEQADGFQGICFSWQ